MAMMQSGLGFSKIIFLVGAGYTGTILVKNSKLSELLGELQNLVKGLENSGDSANVDNDPIAAQVRWLAQEVRQLANTRQITVLNNGSSGQTDISSFILPAATLGALGYGYMWWKGLSLSDLMYVTKRNMAAAVANLTENLQSVNVALEKAKKHLTQRLQNLDGKIDEQKELSKLIMSEVQNARGDIMTANYEFKLLAKNINKLEDKMSEFDQKQNRTLMGVEYLVHLSEAEGKSIKGPAFGQIAEEFRNKSRGMLPSSGNLGLQALMSITDIQLDDGQETRNLMRSTSAKVSRV